jgi:hypothetical protein
MLLLMVGENAFHTMMRIVSHMALVVHASETGIRQQGDTTDECPPGFFQDYAVVEFGCVTDSVSIIVANTG